MKRNLLYHRVQPKYVKSVLKSKSIKPHESIEPERKCICMTRNVVLMSHSRPFVVVFDRDKLKKFFKIEPFCLLGWKFVNNTSDLQRWMKNYEFGFESEERVYGGEIPLELSEYYGELPVGCYDYENPNKVHSHRLYATKDEEHKFSKAIKKS